MYFKRESKHLNYEQKNYPLLQELFISSQFWHIFNGKFLHLKWANGFSCFPFNLVEVLCRELWSFDHRTALSNSKFTIPMTIMMIMKIMTMIMMVVMSVRDQNDPSKVNLKLSNGVSQLKTIDDVKWNQQKHSKVIVTSKTIQICDGLF